MMNSIIFLDKSFEEKELMFRIRTERMIVYKDYPCAFYACKMLFVVLCMSRTAYAHLD